MKHTSESNLFVLIPFHPNNTKPRLFLLQIHLFSLSLLCFLILEKIHSALKERLPIDIMV